MPDTSRFKMSFPSENEDPHYEGLVNFFEEIDANLYANYSLHQPVSGGGEISLVALNSNTSRLSWTEDFEFPVLGSGKSIKLRYGPDGVSRHIDLTNGDRVVFDIALSSAGDIVQNLYKLNGIISADVAQIPLLYTLGIFKNGQFFSKLNGTGGYSSGDLKVTGKLSTTGNVGIGIDSPSEKLEIGGAANAQAVSVQLSPKSSSGALVPTKLTASQTGLSVSIGGTEAAAVSTNGVGFGVSTPAARLDVLSSVAGPAAIISSSNQAQSAAQQIVASIKNTAASGHSVLAVDRKTQSRSAALRFSTNESADWFAGILYNAGTNNSAFSIGRTNAASTSALYLDANGGLGLATAATTGYGVVAKKNITGAATAVGIEQSGAVQADVFTAHSFRSKTATANAINVAEFYHYVAQEGGIGSGSAIDKHIGFNAKNLTASSVYGFQGEISAGSNKYNLYMSGSAPNFLFGSLSIGAEAALAKLHIQDSSTGDVSVRIQNNNDTTGSSATLAFSTSASGAIYGNISTQRVSSGNGKIVLNTIAAGTMANRLTVDSNSVEALATLKLSQVSGANSIFQGSASGRLWITGNTSDGLAGAGVLIRGTSNSTNPNGIELWAGGAEQIRLSNGGRLLFGATAERNNFNGGTALSPKIQVAGADDASAAMSIVQSSTSSGAAPVLFFGRQKSGSVGGSTAVTANDIVGRLSFQGADGTNLVAAATIDAHVDGSAGLGAIPGRIVFSTFGSSLAERMRIDSSGRVGIGVSSPTSTLHVNGPVATKITSSAVSVAIGATDSTVLLSAGTGTTGTVTATLPSAVGCTGRQYTVKRTGNANATFQVISAGGETIDGNSAFILKDQWAFVTVQSTGTMWIVIGTNVIDELSGGVA